MLIFHDIAGVFKNIRESLESGSDEEGKSTRIIWTPAIDFFQHLCLLVPDDLLFAPHLNRPPALACTLACSDQNTTDFLQKRATDISSMIRRIDNWYDRHLPLKTEANESDLKTLLELKKTFRHLGEVNSIILQKIENQQDLQRSGSTTGTESAHEAHSSALCTDSLVCRDIGMLCAYCCSCCCDMVIANEQRHHENVGVTDVIQGSLYGGGVEGFFSEETGGFYIAKTDAYCYECCSLLVRHKLICNFIVMYCIDSYYSSMSSVGRSGLTSVVATTLSMRELLVLCLVKETPPVTSAPLLAHVQPALQICFATAIAEPSSG
jgi:hypothetical protein